MNGILSQYLMRTILVSTALVMTVLLALAGLFELIAELDDVRNDYQTPQAILYAALRLPNLAFELMPVSALIGSLLGLGALAANSEIIVMRSSGQPSHRHAQVSWSMDRPNDSWWRMTWSKSASVGALGTDLIARPSGRVNTKVPDSFTESPKPPSCSSR